MNRIHESLQHVFLNHRIVVWYDPEQEWKETAQEFKADNLEVLPVNGTPFGTKVRVLMESDASKRFLVYVPEKRPKDSENWLLDILLQGHEFKADRVSLAVQEAGLRYEYRPLVERHLAFFKSRERVSDFMERKGENEEEDALILHMMGIYAGTASDLDSMLRKFAAQAFKEPMFDPVMETFKAGDLPDTFWREVGRLFGYQAKEPSMRDFLVFLFRGANPLDPNLKLNSHAAVFLQQWKDSKSGQEIFAAWSKLMEKELNLSDLLKSTGTVEKIGTHDSFEVFERFILHSCCGWFVEENRPMDDIRSVLNSRRTSYWLSPGAEDRNAHHHGYQALLAACELRSSLEGLELEAPSVEEGIRRYRLTWWKVDQAYRQFCFHSGQYMQQTLFDPVASWVEKNYVNGFLLPLSDIWSDLMASCEDWSRFPGVPSQRGFFEDKVRPIVRREQKTAVIISDALRFEAGMELADRLRRINRITVESELMMGSLPGYTQLGMASLLPGVEMELNPETGIVSKDEKSTAGTENRSAILGSYLPGGGCALTSEKFLAMNSHTEGRPLMKVNDVIFIYHNVIDKIGDDRHSEAQTPAAVENAFDEIEKIIKKAVSINFTHVFVTADHGFLFQQEPVSDEDATPLPSATRVLNKNRRFVFGEGIKATPKVLVRHASGLGLPGEWECAFPRSLGRFPLKGSGKRYVHGGLTLQEMLVPVLRIHKKRVDDSEKVGIEILRLPAKITTGQLAVAFYQSAQVTAKVQPRTLCLQLKSEDGTTISDRVTLVFDSQSEEPRKREQTAILTLSKASDPFNNRDVILDVSELRPGSDDAVPYRTETLRLQKSYEGDFDDF